MAKKKFDEKDFVSIEIASEWAKANDITSFRKWWAARKKRPSNIPSDPVKYEAWVSWPHFCGTNRRTRNADYASYSEVQAWAIEICAKLNIKTALAWNEHWKGIKMPDDKYPKNPPYAYGDEFLIQGGWPAFLGNIREFLTYKKARDYIQKLRLQSYSEYRLWAKSEDRPENFPSHPQVCYKKDWESFPVFLGYEKNNDDKLNEALTLLDSHSYIFKEIEGLYEDSDYEEVMTFIHDKSESVHGEINNLIGSNEKVQTEFVDTFILVATA
jgi:hypothetical protein